MRDGRTGPDLCDPNLELTLDGLHGVLDLEEAALGGPDGHVRVVLVAEHAGRYGRYCLVLWRGGAEIRNELVWLAADLLSERAAGLRRWREREK